MDKPVFVLLVDGNPLGLASFRRALGDQAGQFRLQCVEHVATAVARIAGGGVDIVVFHPRTPQQGESRGPDELPELHAGAAGLPIVLVGESADLGQAESAKAQGVAAYLAIDAYDADLVRILDATIKGSRVIKENPPTAGPAQTAKMLAVMGAKGGVGATTVAMNVAATLARDHRVILAEIGALGTLSDFFRPHRASATMSRLAGIDAAKIGMKEVEDCLWPCNGVPGLHILFGSGSSEVFEGVDVERAKAIVQAVLDLADYVVIDLPVSLSRTTRAVVEAANVFALAVDRDAICVQSAKRILHSLESWAHVGTTGAVIVNRTALAVPLPVSEIDAHLSIPVYGVLPPGADLCASAQAAQLPVVSFDPESLLAIGFNNVTQIISGQMPRRGRIERVQVQKPSSRETRVVGSRAAS